MTMLPIMLDVSAGPVLLVGSGVAALRRLRLLEEAGAGDIRLYPGGDALPALLAAAGKRLRTGLPDRAAIREALVLFVAESDAAQELAATARDCGTLVNVEDVKALCDFYTPSVIRRGDLAISVSTNGVSPGVARRIRRRIENIFGPEWAGRLAEIGRLRQGWRADGASMAAVAERTNEWIERSGWL
jgi:precorrin-2 dehydrogenase/sirohydrochlorin ferrochelatase